MLDNNSDGIIITALIVGFLCGPRSGGENIPYREKDIGGGTSGRCTEQGELRGGGGGDARGCGLMIQGLIEQWVGGVCKRWLSDLMC